MNKTHVILIAHGSRDPRWKKPFEDLENSIKSDSSSGKVSVCYMEFTGPTLEDVISREVSNGVNVFKVIPLFMSGGGHVDKDIPKQVEDLKSKYTEVNIEVLSAIGEHAQVINAMKDIVMNEMSLK